MLAIKYKLGLSRINRIVLVGLFLLPMLWFGASPVAAYNSDCDQTTCKLTCGDGTTTQVVSAGPGSDYQTALTGGKTAEQFCSNHGGITSITRLDGQVVAHSGGNDQYQQCQTQSGKNYCSYQCGGNNQNPVKTSINIGCRGQGNPILDMTFAVIRFLSYGVGLVVVASVIIAGIQYTVSRDEPQAVAAAETRIKSAVIALIIFIFAYAILNYVIPAGLFQQ